MTKDELKPQVEEMIYQVLKLVEQLDEKESYELKIELACTVITAAIDFEENDPKQTIGNLCIAIDEVCNISTNGLFEVLLNKKGYRTL